MARTMPRQKRGASKQTYGTPADFLDAAKRRLGIRAFGLDIAASSLNAVASRYYTASQDAFKQSWRSRNGWSWLNPPFDNIGPWAQRCWMESQTGAQIAFLVPASVGANWYRDFVHGKALVLALNGRITFVGMTESYPKDLLLVLYGPTIAPGFAIWTWQ